MPIHNSSGILFSIFKGVVVLAVVAFPFVFFDMIAGDAIIHFVYAKNAAAGHPFEFNLGEKSAGVTSIGYMFLLTLLYKALPELWVPMAVKILNIAAWYGLLWVTYLLASRLLRRPFLAWLSVLVVGTNCGAVYNGTIGMENVVFGLMVGTWTLLAIRWEWFNAERLPRPRQWALGFFMGLAALMRPEGFVLLAIAPAVRSGLLALQRKSLRGGLGVPWGYVACCLLVLVPAVLFHRLETGLWIPNSASARAVQGAGHFSLLGLTFNLKFLVRMVVFFPITLPFLAFFVPVIREPLRHRPLVFMWVVFWVFFCLYSSVLGAAHLARYTIFIIPLWVLVAAASVEWFGRSNSRALFWAGALLATTPVLGVAEYVVRNRENVFTASGLLWSTMDPDFGRRMRETFATLPPGPDGKTSLAVQEVQIRYWLGDEYVVRSLDGRVDSRLLKFYDRMSGNFDHLGYLADRKVDYVLEFPNYNRNPAAWSLQDLLKIPQDETLSVGGMRFSRVDAHVIVENFPAFSLPPHPVRVQR